MTVSSLTAHVHADLALKESPLVVVAAGDRDVRRQIVEALSGADLRVLGTASAQEDLPSAPDLLVVHCERMDSDELLLLRDLKRRDDAPPVVVVCRTADGRCARRAVDAGADGLVLTEHLQAALAPTIAAALAGQTSVPSRLRASLHKASLSFREKQILGMVVMGLTNSQIGARLYLAESTVKSHLSSAFTKLGVRSRSEAAALILDPRESLGAGILATLGPLDRSQIAPGD